MQTQVVARADDLDHYIAHGDSLCSTAVTADFWRDLT